MVTPESAPSTARNGRQGIYETHAVTVPQSRLSAIPNAIHLGAPVAGVVG